MVGSICYQEMIFLLRQNQPMVSAVSGDGITVGLSLDLDEDLLMEGLVRDIVRLVQEMRKNAGFAVEDSGLKFRGILTCIY